MVVSLILPIKWPARFNMPSASELLAGGEIGRARFRKTTSAGLSECLSPRIPGVSADSGRQKPAMPFYRQLDF
jgi:hypothetical protein